MTAFDVAISTVHKNLRGISEIQCVMLIILASKRQTSKGQEVGSCSWIRLRTEQRKLTVNPLISDALYLMSHLSKNICNKLRTVNAI